MHIFSNKMDNKIIRRKTMFIDIMINIERPPVVVASVPQKDGFIQIVKDNSQDTYVFCAPETL